MVRGMRKTVVYILIITFIFGQTFQVLGSINISNQSNQNDNYQAETFSGSSTTVTTQPNTLTAAEDDVQPPASPSGLEVVSRTENSIILAWEASMDNVGVTGYEVYRSVYGDVYDNYSAAGTTAQTSFTDVGLQPETEYVYIVKAYDSAGNISAASSQLSVSTLSLDVQPPTIPTGVEVNSKTSTSVNISWTESTDNRQVEGYEVYKAVYDDVYSSLERTAVTAGTGFTDTGLTPGTTYIYAVKAYDSSGNTSAFSQSLMITTDIQPEAVFVQVDAGKNHTVGLKSDGTVWTWGLGGYGQLGNGSTTDQYLPVQVEGLTEVSAVSAGASHTLALKGDGTVWAWGYNYYGQLGCGNTVNSTIPIQVSNLSDVIAVDGGANHSIVLKSDGSVWAWGYNSYGQLGNGATTNAKIPVQVKDLSGIKEIAAGGYHTAALKNNGSVWTWGNNWFGQLGNGSNQHRYLPVQVQGLTGVLSIGAGDYHTLAVGSERTIWAWGQNGSGQLGNGTRIRSNNPVQVEILADVLMVDGGDSSTVALKNDGTVWVWGDTFTQQLEDGNEAAVTVPEQVITLSTINAVAAGGGHTIALKNDGTVWTWGLNHAGQLGDGTTADSSYPIIIGRDTRSPTVPMGLVAVSTESSVALSWEASTDNAGVSMYEIYRNGIKIAVSTETSYTDTDLIQGITYTYTVRAVDAAGNYSEYSSPVVNDLEPPTVPTELSVVSKGAATVSLEWISSTDNIEVAGYEIYRNGCKAAIAKDTKYVDSGLTQGTTYCYYIKAFDTGLNLSEASNTVSVTTNSAGEIRLNPLAAGSGHTVSCMNDGRVYSWGYNYSGQLGNGTNQDSLKPMAVYTISDTASVYAGEEHTLALKHDGTVWAWGANWCGQLGNNSMEDSNVPVQVAGLTGVNAIASGYYHNAALCDGMVWTWGYNSDGQLGDGTFEDRYYPARVEGITGVVAIAAGPYHTIALKSDGTVWAWGANWSMQLGDGTWENRNSPVQVQGIDGAAAVSGGYEHSTALKNDGTVWSWGSNWCGQLGDGTNDERYNPVQVAELTGVSAVACGEYHTMALKNDGTVWSWGANGSGQLGDGTYEDRNTPVQVQYLENVRAVAASYSHSAAMKYEGTIWAWGANWYGQIGDGTTTTSNIPVLANLDTNAPTAPANLSASIADNAVILSWEASVDDKGVIGYEVFRNGFKIGTSNETSYTDQGVTDIGTYVYTVRAYDASYNLSEPSNQASIAIEQDTVEPSVPIGLCVDTKTSDYITLKWETSTDNRGVSGYEMYRDGNKVGTTPVSSYSDLGLTQGTEYIYAVRAYDWAGNLSGLSEPLIVTTYTDDYGNSRNAAGELEFGSQLSGLINYPGDEDCFSFTPVQEKNYIFEITGSLPIYVILYDRNGTEIDHDDGYIPDYKCSVGANLEVGQTYYVIIGCYEETENGTYGIIITTDTQAPSIPEDLHIVSQKTTWVSLAWSQSTDSIGVEGYEVYRNGVKIGNTVVSSYTDKMLMPGTTYAYTVKAYDTEGNLSAASNTINVTTDQLGPIKTRTVEAGEYHSVAIKNGGEVWTWGYNYYGQLGDGTSTNRYSPVKVSGLTDIKAVSAGEDHTIVLKENGTVWAWGKNYYGQVGNGTTDNTKAPVQVQALTGVTAISSGYNHCAAISEGEVWTWGYNNSGQLGNGTSTNSSLPVKVEGLDNIIDIACGGYHTIALKSDGTAWTWGYNYYGQLGDGSKTNKNVPVQVQGLTGIKAVSGGMYHTLALKNDGTVYAWGANGSGQLGDGTTTDSSIAVQIQGMTSVRAIEGGSGISLALKDDGTVWAWGNNYYGQLGDGTTTNKYYPVQVQGLTDAQAVAAGGVHSTAVDGQDKVWSWGYNYYGQLGDGTTVNSSTPVLSAGDTKAPTVPAGLAATATETTAVLTWTASTDNVGVEGYEIYRNGVEIGISEGTTFTDTGLSPDTTYVYTVKAFDAAGNYSGESNRIVRDYIAPTAPTDLVLTSKMSTNISLAWSASTDDIEVAGYEVYRDGVKIADTAQLSYSDRGLTPNTTYIYTVKAYDSGSNYSEASDAVNVTTDPLGIININPIGAGYNHTIAVKSDGKVWAWGGNDYGQLGDGTGQRRIVPTEISSLAGISAVAGGFEHSISLKDDGTVWTWGYNDYGQLGDGSTANKRVPVQVQGLTGVTAVAAGGLHNAAVSDGVVWAWGHNSYGQLGNGTTTSQKSPVQVNGLTGITSAACGGQHTAALKSDGTVWIWGSNSYGQLGNGSTANSSTPVQVPGLNGVIAIAAGYCHTVVLKNDGTVWAWGYNNCGQLGDGTTANRNTPVQVKGLTGVTSIAAGNEQTIAVKSDGTVWACGRNSDGQLGDGTTTNRSVPVQVKNLTGVITAAAGYYHTAALKSDGTIWTWGKNEYGQLGNGTTSSSYTLVTTGDSQAPTAPSGLTAVSTETSVTLTWTASADNVGVAGYEVYRDGIKIGTSTAFTYTDSGLTQGVTYTYTVKAFDAAGNISETSNSVVNDIQAPGTPADLVVSSTMPATIVLTWTAPTDNVGVTGYEIYRDGGKVAVCTDTTYADTRLVPDTTYTYYVRAYDAGKNLSEASNTVSGTTRPMGSVKIVPVAAGAYHTVSGRSDGTVWTWGSNGSGQLGDGTSTNKVLSAQVPGLTDVSAAAAGLEHTLVLKSDGTVLAWGDNNYGQLGNGTYTDSNKPVKIEELAGVTSIKAGYEHSLVLIDGRVWAWGNNSSGQLGNGTWTSSTTPVQVKGLTGTVAIAAGVSHNLALKDDGTVWTWGKNSDGQLGDGTYSGKNYPVQVQGLTGVIAVAAGNYHSIALKSDGTVWAWGRNEYGQLGDGTTFDQSTPVQVQNLTGIIAIEGGGGHSVSLKDNGTVWTWGYNGYGQLGDGTTNNTGTPVQVSGLDGVINIAAGYYHTAAVKGDGTVWTWGCNWYGQLGDGTTTQRNIPVLVVGEDNLAPSVPADLKAVSTETTVTLTWTASSDNVGVKGYEIYRDGVKITTVTGTTYTDTGLTPGVTYTYTVKAYDAAGNLSEASSPVVNDYQAPSAPSDLAVTLKMSARISLTWTASTDNVGVTGYEIYRNGTKAADTTETTYTDINLNPNTSYTYYIKAFDAGTNKSEASNTLSVTTQPLGAIKVVPIAGGAFHSLAVKGDGTVWTWGYNGNGQLGDGTNTARNIPGKLQGLTNVSSVESGAHHSLILKNDGRVWSCGNNFYGQLGNNSSSNKNTPVLVQNLTGVTAIEAGGYHSAALSDGYVWTWGNNNNGQLGDGTGNTRHAPIQVEGLTNIISTAAGTYHTIALKDDGTVWAWGNNDQGQLGDGTTIDRNSPVQVQGLTGVTAISAGANHNLALKSDGTVWAWGLNESGQLGDGTTTDRYAPAQVTGLTGVISVAVGNSHSLALKDDGTVWAWGNNDYGQLGDGTTTNSNAPVQVENLTRITAVAAGAIHSLAVKGGNTVWSWGYNYYGQLGDGTNTNRLTPVGAGDSQSPSVPANLTAVSTDTSVTLTWSASTDNVSVAGYQVYRDGIQIAVVTEAAYTDTGLEPGATYVYWVKAFDNAGNISEASNQVTNDTQVPTAPTNLTVSLKTVTSITLVWDASADDKEVAGYEVYRSGVKIASVNDTTYCDTELTPDTTYTYYVKAYDAGGNMSEASNVLSASTEADNQAPTAPANLNITSKSNDSVSLAWTASIDNIRVTGYEIYRNNTKISSTINTYYSDTVPETGTYYYTVRAYDAVGNVSEASSTIVFDIEAPTAPTNLTVTSNTVTTVSLSWTASMDQAGVAGYKIYRNDVKVKEITGTTYTDTGLTQNTTYTYYVKAYDEAGNISESSNVISVSTELDTTSPTVPSNLRITSKSGNTVWFNWTASTDNIGVVSYEVYRNNVKLGSTLNTYYSDTVPETGTYYYTVRAYDAVGNVSEASSTIVFDIEAPTAPADLTVASKTVTSISLSWSASTDEVGVKGYEVYRNDVKVKEITGTTYTDTGLTQNTTYTYYVKAYDAENNISEASSILNVTTEPDIQAPSVPANLRVTSKADKTISFAWTASTDNIGVVSYEVYRNNVKLGSTLNTYYSDTVPETGTYYYTVRAYDAVGNVSEPSSTIVFDIEAPTAPADLTVASKTETSISLSWSASTDEVGVKSYEVYRNDVKVKEITGTTYTDTGLTQNTAYNYYVKVYDEAGILSEASNVVSVTTVEDIQPPSTPANLNIYSKTGTSITLIWSAATDNVGVAGYEIYRDGVKVGISACTTYTDKGLTANTTYTYYVKAYDALGYVSEASGSKSATPVMPHISGTNPVNGVTIGGDSNHRMHVYFTNANNAPGARAEFEYTVDGTNWTPLSSSKHGPYSQNSSTLYFYCDWNLSPISTGEYTVRYSVYDAEDNYDMQTTAYMIDRTAPSIPQNLIVSPDSGMVNLVWEPSVDADVSLYKVYRSSSSTGPFDLIAEVSGRANVTYTDKSVQPEKNFCYRVTAVDKFNQESEPSAVAEVIAQPDTVSPVILGIEPVNDTVLGIHANITVRAEDNLMLSSIKIQRLADGADTWEDIKTIFTTGNATFSWDTAPLNGEVRIRAIARDTAGNESDGNPIRIYVIDSQGPAQVTGLTAVVSTNVVTLRWNDVADDDFSYFQVERKDSAEGAYKSIGKVNTILGMNITGLKPSTTYWFRVAAYDRLGNRGIPSEEIEVTTTPDTQAPVVTRLEPKPGRFSSTISLIGTASDNVGVSSFTFQTSFDRVTWNDVVTLVPTVVQPAVTFTYNLDVSAMTEGALYVRGIARDEAGNLSDASSSAPFVEYRIDHTPPSKPENFTITPSSGYITLDWTQGAESDLSSYRIYRALNESGPYTLIGDNTKYINYRDRDVQAGITYYYKLIAIDSSGNQSQEAGPISGQLLPDTEAPQILSVYPGQQSVLPANPVIGVLSSDNYKLERVTVEYQIQGQPEDQWISIGSKELDVYSQVVSLSWDTSPLSSGSYKVRVTAYDQAGNASAPMSLNYELNVDPPEVPVVTAIPGGWKVDLSWTTGGESDLAGFRIYRSTSPDGPYRLIKETRSTNYSDTPIEPGQNYYYKVEAVDIYRNASMSTEVSAAPLSTDPYAPVAEAGIEMVATVGMEVQFDGTLSKDNHRIASYHWNFGDGKYSNIAQPAHAYAAAGTYTVTLTVKDPAGNSAVDTTRVIVYPEQQVGKLEVKVIDHATGIELKEANVYVDFPDETPKHFITNGYGIANVVGVAGHYNVSAYKTGYLPTEVNTEIKQYLKSTITIRLKKGELVVGELKVRRMMLDEIVAAGIDIKAPENQHVFKYEVHLTFNQQPLPVQYLTVNGFGDIYSGGGTIRIGGSGGGYDDGNGQLPYGGYVCPKAIPHVDHPEVAPTIAYMVIPKSATWLKEFFEVGLVLQNMADPQFVIRDSTATINLPDGLVLAPTREQQSLTINIGEIAGQETKEVKWIIRGDKKGYYDLEADFNGTLMPFEAPVSTTFKTSEPFRVWGGDALHIYVEAEEAAYIGEQYFIQFRIANESDAPIYNLKADLGGPYDQPPSVHEVVVVYPDGTKDPQRSEEGNSFSLSSPEMQEYLPYLQAGDSMEIQCLMPGQSILGTYVTYFSAPGDPDEVYYVLENAFSVALEGSTTEVPVTITKIPSHVTKYKLVIIDQSAMWADPVDTTSGAHVIEREALSVMGASQLSFDLEYNSLLTKEGTMGKGWSHNYETKLKKLPDGTVQVYWSPSNFTKFFRKDALNRQTYGALSADGTIVVAETIEMTEQEYYSKAQGMKDYILKRNEDGSYTLICGNKNAYYFDSEGRLVKLRDRNGKYIIITRTEDGKLVISEPVSGQTLTVNYNSEGLVESVADQAGREVTFAYENNCLTGITDAAGKTTAYTYDAEGYVLTGTDGEGITFFTNTYDDKGRVLTQDDGVAGNGLTHFSYDDTSEYWRTIITITDRNGNTRKHVNNRLGQLVRIEDELGNKTTFTYDEYGNRTSVTDPNGYTTIYTYDDHGNVLTVSDAEGTKTVMTYDENDNLLTVENANSEKVSNTYDSRNLITGTTDQLGNNTANTYNDDGQVLTSTIEGIESISYTYENGRIKTSTDFLGNTKTLEYDTAGRIVSVTDREGKTTTFEYDAADNKISETDPMGNKMTYTYDSRHNVLTETDQRGNTTSFKYNGNGKLIEVTDPQGNKTTYEYDWEDRLVKTTDAMGNTVETTYDATGRAIATKDVLGNITKYTYDSMGQILTVTSPGKGVTSYTYYKNGKLKTITDPAGNTTTYYYDAAWRVSKITNAAGKSTIYTYDSAGNVLSITDPLGNKISYTYDGMGNMLTETDAKGNTTKFAYNANSKLTSVTDVFGNKTEYLYDNEDRLVKIIDAKGNETTMTYDDTGMVTSVTDALGNTVSVEYDAAGNLINTKDAYGIDIIKTTYDEMNRPLTVEDALGNRITNNYDSLGRLVEIVDALNNSTKISYDGMDRVVTVRDPLNGESKQTFDEDGNLKTLTDPNGSQAVFTYDAAGRLISETTAIGSVKTHGYNSLNLLSNITNGRGQETTYQYDDAERLTSFTDTEGTVSYTYDANGNVLTVSDAKGTIKREYDALDRIKKYTDYNGNTVEYSYDTVGNLVALSYPGGKKVRYEYDAVNRLVEVTDWANRATNYEYDKNGRLTKTTRPNGTVLTISYDAAGRMLQQKDADSAGSVINQYDYTYDEAGNVTVEQSSNEPQPFQVNDAVMTYDKGNRLITYNGQTVEYDADGNMTYGPLNGQMVTFTYDSRNRLIQAGNTSYEYDAENNRTAVIENGVRTEYVINPHSALSQLLVRKDAQGNETFYVYGLGLIGHEESDGTYRTYHYDLRGSTTAITGIDGTVTDRFEYAPYGELVSRTGTTDTPFLYNGRDGVMTDSSGLYYMRARYYNPEIKRFINQDVIQGSILDGRSLNRYAYVNGNPVSLTDPFGLSPELTWSSVGHGLLDIISIFDPFGAADAINATWYTGEGDYTNAALCAANVALPAVAGLGVLAVKWGGKAFKSTKVGTKIVGYSTRAVDYGKVVGSRIADSVSMAREAWKSSNARKWVANKVGIGKVSKGVSEAIENTNSLTRNYINKHGQKTSFGDLDPGTLGETDMAGNIIIKRGLKGEKFREVYKHEMVHRFFTPSRGPFKTQRQYIGALAYSRSSLVRYLEEAAAQAVGSGSLRRGLMFPIKNGYVKTGDVLMEAAAYVGVVGTGMYAGYTWVNDQMEGDR